MMTQRVVVGAAVLAAAGLAGCQGEDLRYRNIDTSREVDVVGAPIDWSAGSAQRFGLSSGGPVQPPPAPSGAGAGSDASLTWETPAGWTEAQPTQFRAVNFVVPGETPGECYLTVLRGDAGGLAANVNRWRQQMGQPPMAASDLASLPRLPFFGGEAVYIDVEGSFSGMSGDLEGEGYRMLGLLQIDAESSRFLKLVGPSDVVAAQVQSFRNLAASFEVRAAEAPAGHARPGGHASSGGLAWSAPEHWQPAPTSAMRQVNFTIGPDGDVECYVTILAGGAGGELANVNRWRSQMGNPELTSSELAGLERFPMLDSEAVLVEIQGTFASGGRQIPDALMLGVVCEGPRGSTFVKMIGPRERVDAEREAFLSFCRSLRSEG